MISAIGWGGEASCSRSCGRRFLRVGRAERHTCPEVAFGAFYFEAMRAAPTLQIPSKNGLRCIVRHDI